MSSRLTGWTLADFARIVPTAFCAATQQFKTTTLMGIAQLEVR